MLNKRESGVQCGNLRSSTCGLLLKIANCLENGHLSVARTENFTLLTAKFDLFYRDKFLPLIGLEDSVRLVRHGKAESSIFDLIS